MFSRRRGVQEVLVDFLSAEGPLGLGGVISLQACVTGVPYLRSEKLVGCEGVPSKPLAGEAALGDFEFSVIGRPPAPLLKPNTTANTKTRGPLSFPRLPCTADPPSGFGLLI